MLGLAVTILPVAAVAQPTAPWPSPYAAIIDEAAARFALPAALIIEVIRAESGGQARAVSPAGALGLMQVMPSTYAALRTRHGLGADPFDPRDNILAGTAYLREMLDRFGAQGVIAAYHAGPSRYAVHLATGRPLPIETLAHVQRIASRIAGYAPAGMPPLSPPRSHPWTHGPLFVLLAADRPADDRPSSPRSQAVQQTARRGQADSIFVARHPHMQ